MFGKKVTILVIPEGSDRIRKLSISKRLPLTVVLMCLSVIAILTGFSVATHLYYSNQRDYTDEVVNLRHEAVMQNVQIHAFADKVRVLEQELARLQQYDRKLRALTGKGPLNLGSTVAMGGSDSEVIDPTVGLRSNTEDLVRQMHRDLDRLLAEASVLEISHHDLSKFFEDSKSFIAATPTDWPLKGTITSYFGYRKSPFGNSRQFHRGLDISRPTGTPIVSPADGMVVEADWSSGYGRLLAINHGYGVVTRYGHCSEIFVKPGQLVKRGQKVAAVGSSGRVTGAHLHYEVILNGIPVNPMKYLTAGKKAPGVPGIGLKTQNGLLSTGINLAKDAAKEPARPGTKVADKKADKN